MKNPFDDARADEEFVAATKDAKLREKLIAKLCKVRKRNNVCLLILVVAVLFLMSIRGKNFAALDAWFYAFVIFTSLASSLYIDLQIKFLKAVRG